MHDRYGRVVMSEAMMRAEPRRVTDAERPFWETVARLYAEYGTETETVAEPEMRSDIGVYLLVDEIGGNTVPAYYCGGCAVACCVAPFEIVPVSSFTQDTPDGGYVCDACLAAID